MIFRHLDFNCHWEYLKGAWQSPSSTTPPGLLRLTKVQPRNDMGKRGGAALAAPIRNHLRLSLKKGLGGVCLYPTSPEDEHYDHNHQDSADADNHPHPEWSCGLGWVMFGIVCFEFRLSVEAHTVLRTTERTSCSCGEGAYGARAYDSALIVGGHLPVVGGVVLQRLGALVSRLFESILLFDGA